MVSISSNSLSEANKICPDLVNFLKDLISIPGESGQEKEVVERIKLEMEKIGYDRIIIDDMGNIIGQIGSGKTVLHYDAHIDTVGTGNLAEWKRNPYEPVEKDGRVYGRGAADQLAGAAAMVYSAYLIKKLALEGDYTLYVTGTCHEEACEGLCIKHIYEKQNIFKPDYVLLTEPTDFKIALGHRGRVELVLETVGKACHASIPDDGVNAVYLMQPLIQDIEKLNKGLKRDPFLGKGSVVVTKVETETPALCAVPDKCIAYIDRRLTIGESKELALNEIQGIINRHKLQEKASVKILQYKTKAWTGLELEEEKYFPVWRLESDHKLAKATIQAYKDLFKEEPVVDKWLFATNGVATMGHYGIPSIGFGPANDRLAHTVEEFAPIDQLVRACAFYAYLPQIIKSPL